MYKKRKQEAKVIWQKLHRMTPTHNACASDLSRMTDRLTDEQTDTANIGNNSLHLMHLMQPKNVTQYLLYDKTTWVVIYDNWTTVSPNVRGARVNLSWQSNHKRLCLQSHYITEQAYSTWEAVPMPSANQTVLSPDMTLTNCKAKQLTAAKTKFFTNFL